ncbi:hypothetical protein AN944_02313 [Shewanella sp. P1-14-1]|uniref:DUF4411 family protein n=1 Tax=Shewanella sp. P1-14-1 TaxID=1723761 RepID=UPI0006D680A3|nr:DUF4411 family protein [Shewanella sp. P1-14-1]KPZ70241.1 hypothetical protein AN944_02313 [Shewanella sp. P1-14-1]
MKFLLDANTFIEAKGRYYGMTICPAYWEWLLKAHEKGEIISIEMVKDELLNGNDLLEEWVRNNQHIFMPESDSQIQTNFGVVVQTVFGMTQMKQGTHEEFMSGADPWLIATAMTTGATIVTQEVYKRDIKKKIHIPNVCEILGVKYMNTFEMLHELQAEFVLPAA